ncbi:hypothetical protein IFM89_000547, partial [Coptis chinensis]
FEFCLDLILAVDGSASELVREIATECGVDFDEDSRAVVIDHGRFANGDHMLIASDDFIDFMMSFWGRKNRSSCTIPRDWCAGTLLPDLLDLDMELNVQIPVQFLEVVHTTSFATLDLRLLAVHIGANLESAIDTCLGYSAMEYLSFVKMHIEDKNIGPVMEGIMFFISLMLQNLCLSTVDNEDLIYCTKVTNELSLTIFCMQRVTRPRGGINDWFHWLPVSLHKKLDYIMRRIYGDSRFPFAVGKNKLVPFLPFSKL